MTCPRCGNGVLQRDPTRSLWMCEKCQLVASDAELQTRRYQQQMFQQPQPFTITGTQSPLTPINLYWQNQAPTITGGGVSGALYPPPKRTWRWDPCTETLYLSRFPRLANLGQLMKHTYTAQSLQQRLANAGAARGMLDTKGWK